jgi:exonuclease III
MKVITWNVNNRVGTVSQQVQELGQREPDVVALQDVNYNAVAYYIEAFRRIGLPHILHTLERQPQAVPTGVLLASRFPLSLLPDGPESILWSQGTCSPDHEKLRQHWSRRTLFALLHSPWGEIELENVYITPANHYEPGANGGHQLYPYLKLDLLAGLYQALATLVDRPGLLCGDFNAPQHERENGEIITWGYLKRHGDYTLKYPRQHELELRILRELSGYDLHDVYRRLHGYAVQTQEEGWSWCYRNRFRYRFDHLFASHALCPVQARYLHAFRESRLSDHTPLEALFEPAGSQDVWLHSDYLDYGDDSDDGDRRAYDSLAELLDLLSFHRRKHTSQILIQTRRHTSGNKNVSRLVDMS